MQGSANVLEVLNESLTAELTAVNQYFIASKMAANWALPKLAKSYYAESIGEMRHAENLIERILLLEGTPNMQRLFNVVVGEHPVEQFRLNYDMEKAAVERYRRAVGVCIEEGDPGTRLFLERFLLDEESHVDEAESELDLLERIGEQLWLLRWAEPDSE